MMNFKTAQIVNDVYEACFVEGGNKQEIIGSKIIAHICGKLAEGEIGKRQHGNILGALGVLEGMNLITHGRHKTNTRIMRSPLETYCTKLTLFGRKFKILPRFLRAFFILLYLQKRKATAVLGFLAFIPLCDNAIKGVKILAEWTDYVAAFIIAYLLLKFMKKIFT